MGRGAEDTKQGRYGMLGTTRPTPRGLSEAAWCDLPTPAAYRHLLPPAATSWGVPPALTVPLVNHK